LPAAEPESEPEETEPMVFVLLLIIVAIILGIVGAVAHGLLYLLIIGVAVFLIALGVGALIFRRGGRRVNR
jgi:hypothetical protein